MSIWHEVEAEVAEALRGLTRGAGPLFATVKGLSPGARRSAAWGVAAERLPGAYVTLAGQKTGDGKATLNVVLAVRNLRGDEAARVGDAGTAGVYELAERVAGALHGRVLASDRRLWMEQERAIGGDEGAGLWEQAYAIARLKAAPTWGGAPLAGEGSEVAVEVGALRAAVSAFSFPGIDGVFERPLGTRGRTIRWIGELRSADDGGLSAIEATIEAEISAGRVKTMADGSGRTWEGCAARAFRREGSRRVDEVSGERVQRFELEFSQAGG